MDDRDWVSRAAAGFEAGRPLALLFDYDGALAPPTAHPRNARLADDTRGTLAGLAALDGVTLGVLSGRPLAELRRLVGVSGVLLAGSGGTQLDLGGGELLDPAAAEFGAVADLVVASLAAAVGWFPGAWIEPRPGCLAVHVHRLSPLKAACLADEVREVVVSLAEAGPPLRVRESGGALVVAPADGWGVAEAVDRMLAGLRPDVVPVFAGAADPDTAVRVVARGGWGVAASAEELAADLRRLAVSLGRRRAGDPVLVGPAG